VRIAAALALLLVAGPARAERPIIDGTVESHASADGHFRIWYTLDGGDALDVLSGDDDPANGVPDAIDVVEEGLALCWQRFVEQEGWRPPGDDEGEGGDSRLDVYLRHIDNNGLASYEWHTDHWAAYLQIEPDLAEMGGDLMASVAAHELHHAIQYSYTVDPHTWVHEASATYAQYLIYADSVGLAAGMQLLWGIRIEDPGIALDTLGDRQEYAGLLWVKFLVDRAGGDPSAFRRWWEILAEDPDWEASIATLADEYGEGDACALFAEYGEWLYFACARDDGDHWLSDGLDCLLDIRAGLDHDDIVPPQTWEPTPPEPFGFSLNVAQVTASDLTVTADGPPAGGWATRAVPLSDGDGLDGTTASPDGDGRAELDLALPAEADQLLLVLASCGDADGFELSLDEAGTPGDDDDILDAAQDDAEGCACSATDRPGAGSTLGLLGLLGVWRRRLSARRGR